MAEENKIRDAADAVKGVVQAIPIYQDALQPAVKEAGKALTTITKTIHVALAPIAALVWGYEKISEFVATELANKLKNTPPEFIQTPRANVAGPTLEALRYTGHDPDLREMYASLLASSMDSRISKSAHPSFVDIIKQLSPDEARLISKLRRFKPYPVVSVMYEDKGLKGSLAMLRRFSLLGLQSNCTHPELTTSYLDNLERLGLIEIETDKGYSTPGTYDEIESHPTVKAHIRQIDAVPGVKSAVKHHTLELTDFGLLFLSACVTGYVTPSIDWDSFLEPKTEMG